MAVFPKLSSVKNKTLICTALYPLQRASTRGVTFDLQVALRPGRVGVADSSISLRVGMEHGINTDAGISPDFLRLKLRLMEVSWVAHVHNKEPRTSTLNI